jgi:D-glycero-beta-D-manno-heptose-7-phosphate kinase
MNLNFSNQVGIVIGDFMLDEYLYTKFIKDSPECNAPVVGINQSNHFAGGAGNVVMNLNALGVKVIPVGCVGDDEKGKKLLDIFRSNDINTNYIQCSSNVSTTHKKRLYVDNIQKVRIDSDSNYSNLKNIHSSILKNLSKLIQSCNFLILSDYNKSLITKDFSHRVISVCNELDIPVIVDPKKESLEYYQGASTITPNEKEAKLLYNSESMEHLIPFFQKEIVRLNIESVLFKVGKDGMIVITKDYIKKIKGIDVRNPDVTGAGDTVISIFSIMLSLNNSLIDCATVANIGASLVVAKEETATVSYSELSSTIKKLI